MVGSGSAGGWQRRKWDTHLPAEGGALRSATAALAGFKSAGANARVLLERLGGRPFDNDELPFMGNCQAALPGAPGVDGDAVVIRVSFTGDLGFEIYVAERFQLALYQAIFTAAADLGVALAPVGSRALGSLRIEKTYGSWGREYSPEWWPHESGLAALVKDKPAFLGRDAWLDLKHRRPRQVLKCFAIDVGDGGGDSSRHPRSPLSGGGGDGGGAGGGADAWGGETIYHRGQYAGRVTSGAFGFSVGKSLALGYIDAKCIDGGAGDVDGGGGDGDGDAGAGAAGAGGAGGAGGDSDSTENNEFEIAILGRPHRATLLAEPPFDPKGLRLRG